MEDNDDVVYCADFLCNLIGVQESSADASGYAHTDWDG